MIQAKCTERKVGKPKWLTRKLPTGPEYEKVRTLLKGARLNTVCQEAKCPNQFECYSKGTSTFMILGERCTRNCRFCAVAHAPELPPDPEEPRRVAETAAAMELRYVVVTSVTRDDCKDGGASIFADTIKEVTEAKADALVEVLIPDLAGNWEALRTIVEAGPAVLNHNIETVPRLYGTVRPGAVYARSLELIREVKKIDPTMPTKTGIMVGLGETDEEILDTLRDLRRVGCDLLTIGQYLQPSIDHLPVERYVSPDEFDALAEKALELGFAGVAAGPFVRSSYQAEKLYRKVRRKAQA